LRGAHSSFTKPKKTEYMKKQKFDIAETVTNNLIDIIEKTGKLPWEKEWSASGSSFF